MTACDCTEIHNPRRIVLTGGPGAGKTAVLELVRQSFCRHVTVLPESAGIVFGGGFPRGVRPSLRRAGQRAVFHVQRELEASVEDEDVAIVLCDRGTIDGGAYWPGPGEFWTAVGTTLDQEFQRYAAVIHLRTPSGASGYNHRNPLRTESAVEAAAIDARIAEIWRGHPHLHMIEPTANFLEKATRAIEIIRTEVPECCRHHIGPLPR